MHALLRLLPIAAIAAVLITASAVDAADYSFIKIADRDTAGPTGEFVSFSSFPVVNDRTVAFSASYEDSNHAGVFTGGGGALTTIVKTGDAAPLGTFSHFLFAGPALSTNTVAFRGSYNTGNGIFTNNGNGLTTIAKSGDPAPVGAFAGFGEPAIDGGAVAFYGEFNRSSQNGVPTSDDGIFLASAGTLVTIAKTGDPAPIGTFSSLEYPALSGDTTAFSARDSGGSGIFAADSASLVTIVRQGDSAPVGAFDGPFDATAISGDTVAFSASYNSRRASGVFAGSGGALTTIAKTGDLAPVGSFRGFGAPAIAGDTLVFRGTYAAFDQYGIFLSRSGSLSTIIKTGDSLFGSVVDSVGFGRFGLDPGGSGSLAFSYSLLDGNRGIALAVLVPEPNSLWLLIAAVLSLAGMKTVFNPLRGS